jgi:ABC-type uncharacterized transport system auxiliary subunit
MIMTKINRRIALASTLAVAACSSGPVPTDTFYRLRSANPPSRTGGPIKGVAEVLPLRGEGIINERAILYRMSGTELRQYTYHFWADGPAAMLQNELIAALRKANAFESVVKPELRLNRDFEIAGRISKLEHDTSGTAKAILEIEFSVRRVAGNQQALMKTYTAEVDAAGRSVAAAVDAFSEAFGRVVTAFVADLAGIA